MRRSGDAVVETVSCAPVLQLGIEPAEHIPSTALLGRVKEKPQRAIRVWGFDVSKQVVSTGAAHVCGMPA